MGGGRLPSLCNKCCGCVCEQFIRLTDASQKEILSGEESGGIAVVSEAKTRTFSPWPGTTSSRYRLPLNEPILWRIRAK